MTKLFVVPSSKLFRTALNPPMPWSPQNPAPASPVATPASPVANPSLNPAAKGFLTRIKNTPQAQRSTLLQQMLNYRTPDKLPSILESLRNDPEIMSDPALSSIVQQKSTQSAPVAPAAKAPTPVAPQPANLDDTIPATPTPTPVPPASNVAPTPTQEDLYELTPGDSDERQPYDLAPAAPIKSVPQTRIPRPSQAPSWNATRQQNPAAPGVDTQTAPAVPAQTSQVPGEAPWTGNAQQNPGFGGWLGNAIGRGLKAPGRWGRDVWRDIKQDVINPMQQGFQNFKQDFRNAGSEGKILTAAASSAYNRISKY